VTRNTPKDLEILKARTPLTCVETRNEKGDDFAIVATVVHDSAISGIAHLTFASYSGITAYSVCGILNYNKYTDQPCALCAGTFGGVVGFTTAVIASKSDHVTNIANASGRIILDGKQPVELAMTHFSKAGFV